jgi:hypothetical protein
MACEIVFSLVQEFLAGDIGDDWEYSVLAEVRNPTVVSSGEIRCPEHKLTPGTNQPPPNSSAIVLRAGDCGTSPSVRLVIHAKEVDLLVDDKGSNETIIPMECPGPGGAPYIIDPTISVHVKERPSLRPAGATLTIKVRLVARCV